MPIASILEKNLRRLLAPARQSARAGQSIIESCLVICLICLIFMGALQIADLCSAREILYYAASCSARCRTVGLNRWMVEKTGRVAAIPNAGIMTVPQYDPDTRLHDMIQAQKPGPLFATIAVNPSPASLQYLTERGRIPDYMASDYRAQSEAILNYENWDSISMEPGEGQIGDGTIPQILHVTARQTYKLWVPMHRAYYASDSIELQGEADIESHYPLYIDDQSW